MATAHCFVLWGSVDAARSGLSVMGGVAVLYALVIPMSEVVRAIALVATILVTLWFLALPLLSAIHYASILRGAVVLPAEVSRVHNLQPREVIGKSVDSMKNGTAVGEVVMLGTGERMPFETDEPWARELQPGSRLNAVIDPERRKILMLVPV